MTHALRMLVIGLLTCVSCSTGTAQNDVPWPGAASVDTQPQWPGQRFTQSGTPNQRRRSGAWGRWWRGSTRNQKNNSEVKSAYTQPANLAAKSTGQVLVDGKAVALATVVDSDGYLVTKASLLGRDNKLMCKLPGHGTVDAALVGQNEDYDLALLKVDSSKLASPSWRGDKAGPGTFVAAVDSSGAVINLGVVSTELRAVRGTRQANPRRAWLGVSLGGGPAGTIVTEVIPGSAAQRAGIKSGDLIKGIGGDEMKTMDEIIDVIGNHHPDDGVKILVQRDTEVLELSATLGRPPQSASPKDQWGGGPFSVRREGFPQVLIHDTIIRPEQCGGPLIDTDGNIVGVNIARALRVTTYAIPAATVQKLVREMKKS